MLTPDYLDTLPDALVALWQQAEDDILRDVARRIGKVGGLSDTARWQLWRLEQTRAMHSDVIKVLARYTGKSDAEIRRLLVDAGTETLAQDDAAYQALGFSPSAIDTNPALLNLLQAGYRQTLGEWRNLTATTAHTVTRQFEDSLDRAWLQVSSGAFDYQTAIRRSVDELAKSMKYVQYPTGHRDSLEVAVRRAVLTGVNQTAGKLQVARMDEMDCEFVETTAHAGARPEHAEWQGKVFHRGGAVTYHGTYYPDFEQATGYGTGGGLCGWNCRHSFYPFWPDLSEPLYTKQERDALSAKTEPYNDGMYSKYEISQMQRALERKVRDAKRKYLAEDAAGVDTAKAAGQLAAARQQLKAFANATGGRVDSVRGGVHGFGHSAASKAVYQAKLKERLDSANTELQSLRESGKIRTKGLLVTPPQAPESLIFEREHVFDRIIEREMKFTDADKIIAGAAFAIQQQGGAVYCYYSRDGFVAVRNDGMVYSMGHLDDGGKLLMEVAEKHGFKAK